MTKPQPAAPRSLADALRQRDDSGIAGLLTARPDLLHPVPSDFTALATRATSGPSVSRCLDALTSLELFVLSTAAHLSSDAAVDTSDLADAATAGIHPDARSEVEASIRRLINLALLWGSASSVRAIHPVREAMTGVNAPPKQ